MSMESAPVGRIVVGVDGSAESRQALRWAVSLAGLSGAQVEAVAAWQTPAEYGWLAWPNDWDPASETRRMLDGVLTGLADQAEASKVQARVVHGHAAQVLLDEARGAMMLVVGSRGYGAVPGLFLGSVSARVAEHAPCPVLVVHGDGEPLKAPVPVGASAGIDRHAKPVWG